LPHPAVALEAVQEPRHARGRQHQPLREVDSLEAELVGMREVEERLVVVDRQPVLGDQACGQLPVEARMRPQSRENTATDT
jgi:hypothetical protein